MKRQRPKIRPPRKFCDRVLESIAICSVLLGVYLVIRGWSSLPATIPIHFDASGTADGFGPKGMIWLLPAISVVMVPLMLFLRKFPWLSNTPIQITEENAEYQYGLIVRLLSLLACAVALLFTVLVYDTIAIAGGGSSLLGWWFLPIFIGGVIAPILWYFFKAFKGR
ncbi:MAG: DUF1648 domain-containing protein [Planctomycetes bacterium]|nr:DUF1648 domain-containing protein [Planctomycetota bacterium]